MSILGRVAVAATVAFVTLGASACASPAPPVTAGSDPVETAATTAGDPESAYSPPSAPSDDSGNDPIDVEPADDNSTEFVAAKSYNVRMSAPAFSTGWKQLMKLELSSPIRGSEENLDRINALWHAVGGDGTAGCIDAASGTATNWGIVKIRNSAIWVGRLSFQNLTKGYEPGVPNWGFGAGFTVYGVQTSDGVVCHTQSSLFGPSFGENVLWGPAPFILIVGNAYTADHPDGVDSLKQGMLIDFVAEKSTLPTP